MLEEPPSLGRYQSLLALFLLLTADQSLTSRKLTRATRIAPKQSGTRTWGRSSQLIRHRNERSQQKNQYNHEFSRTIVLGISPGGGNASNNDDIADEECPSNTGSTKPEKESFINKNEAVGHVLVCGEPTVLTIGFIDISLTGTNLRGFCSSVVLVVDDEARNDSIIVDETMLQRNLLPVRQRNPSYPSTVISSKEVEKDTKTIFESLSLLCDVLVVEIGEDEEENLPPQFLDSMVRGNRQRKSAGMREGLLWISSSKGLRHGVRHFCGNGNDADEDDNFYHSSTTTWSTLFPILKGDKEKNSDDRVEDAYTRTTQNPQLLRELFGSLSEQVIQSNRISTQKSKDKTTLESSSGDALVAPFPTVSAQYMIKNIDDPSQSRGMKTAPIVTKKESALVQSRSQIPSPFPEIYDIESRVSNKKNKMGQVIEQKDYDTIVGEEVRTAYRRLEDLEAKMQELVLESSSNPMPLLEFGTLVQDILQDAVTQLKEKSEMADAFRRGLLKGINAEVQRLYNDQLQALRNYYGQRYESILDEELNGDVDNGEMIERKRAIGAEHMTQAFLSAALNAVPVMYRNDPKGSNNGSKVTSQPSFDHVDALRGLIQDMMESTERRKDEQNIATMLMAEEEDEEGANSSSTSARELRLPKLPKWLERLAARAVVFGVNYIQGWLAWQGIKRAALERDRNQPKFPLF